MTPNCELKAVTRGKPGSIRRMTIDTGNRPALSGNRDTRQPAAKLRVAP